MLHDIRNPMLLLCASFAALTTGCGTTATISRFNQPEIEGKIVSADDGILVVETRAGNDSIALLSVTDIDHPGNVASTIGTVLTGYGIANIAIGVEDCERGGAAYCLGVFLPAAIGVPLMAWGFATWGRSVAAASPSSKRDDVSFTVLPTAAIQKNDKFLGVNATVTY
ncbi:hypothetical protein [Polyangium sp. y55x31]|uniref:hypothetical protein n=1 Tax=Polyangium sp. y55x31 TaxID=3042688 RepID=UPI002482CC19|nr:hypothetical protein [Polyangium sp. y55x31]MDI1479272.1 hypothetical protein [Polyangium sp. y55x31]